MYNNYIIILGLNHMNTEDCKTFISQKLIILGIRSENPNWKRMSKTKDINGNIVRLFQNPYVGEVSITEQNGTLTLESKKYIEGVQEQERFTLIGATYKWAKECLRSCGDDWEPPISKMSNEDLADSFRGAGFMNNEDEYAGLFDIIPANIMDYEMVCQVTGVPADLEQYLEETRK